MIKTLPVQSRPREKALQYGISSLSDAELLAVILRNGYKGYSSIELADNILKEAGGLSGLMKMDIKEIMNMKGVKLAKSVQIMASLELVRRICYEDVQNAMEIDRPEAISRWLQKTIGNSDKENFMVLFLDAGNRVRGHEILFTGSVDSVQIDMRVIFNAALKNHASRIIIAHNHPSQRVNPSQADLELTASIANAGKLLNIPLIDHVIVSFSGAFSFRENRLLAAP